MLAYAEAANYTSNSFYFLREPIVWYSLRIGVGVTNSPEAAIIIIDLILGAFLLLNLNKVGLPVYSLFAILIFFAFVIGYQNVYRQWVSFIFFIIAFQSQLLEKGIRFRLLFLALAGLSHNSALILAPILFLRKSENFIFAALTFASLLGLFIFSGSKSSPISGIDSAVIYLSMICLISVGLCFMPKVLNISAVEINNYKVNLSIIGTSLFSYFALSPGSFERLGLTFLIIQFLLVVSSIENSIKQKRVSRVTAVVLAFLPNFFTPIFWLGV
jgi:hypothetical protein